MNDDFVICVRDVKSGAFISEPGSTKSSSSRRTSCIPDPEGEAG